jgi:hypothetical protein
MTRSIRLVARSRRLLALAFLAWLFLLVTPASGVPASSSWTHAANHPATASTRGPCDHAAVLKADHRCCGQQTSCCADHACACGASVGAIASFVLHGLSDVSMRYVRPVSRSVTLPRSMAVPPLRPPTL